MLAPYNTSRFGWQATRTLGGLTSIENTGALDVRGEAVVTERRLLELLQDHVSGHRRPEEIAGLLPQRVRDGVDDRARPGAYRDLADSVRADRRERIRQVCSVAGCYRTASQPATPSDDDRRPPRSIARCAAVAKLNPLNRLSRR